MATYQQSTTQASLNRVYDRTKLFEPCERLRTRFWDDMAEADDIKALGQGLFFRIIGSLGWGVGNPDQTSAYSTPRTRNEIDCSVTNARVDSTVQVSSDFIDASEGDGSYSGDAEREIIKEAALQMFSYLDILTGAGYAAGDLATVNGVVDTSATAILAWPTGAFQLRPNMTVDVVDSSGDVSASAATILSIDYTVPSVTFTTTVNLQDLDKIYITGQYGKTFPNGLRNIVDDGDLAPTIFNQSRATYPYLSAVQINGAGGLEQVTEQRIDDFLNQISMGQDFRPTQLRSNVGIATSYRNLLTKDRVYAVTGAGIPKYDSGADNESLTYTYAGKKLDWKVDYNLPARTLYALWWPGFRKHTLHKADWFRYKDGAIFLPAPATTTYSYSFIGSMYTSMNISNRKLNANGLRQNFSDPLCGDV